jgi:hypothetical protein
MGLSSNFSGFHLIYIAPNPRFSALNRPHQRVLSLMEVLGGMLVLRGIATADLPALQAHAEVDPGIPCFYALFTDVLIGVFNLDVVEMGALLRHRGPPSWYCFPGQVTWVM